MFYKYWTLSVRAHGFPSLQNLWIKVNCQESVKWRLPVRHVLWQMCSCTQQDCVRGSVQWFLTHVFPGTPWEQTLLSPWLSKSFSIKLAFWRRSKLQYSYLKDWGCGSVEISEMFKALSLHNCLPGVFPQDGMNIVHMVERMPDWTKFYFKLYPH